MSSKYDRFWQDRLPALKKIMEEAADGVTSELDVSELRRLGQRNSWGASVRVQSGKPAEATMAHAISLGKTISASEFCKAHPDFIYNFTITPACHLTVTIERGESNKTSTKRAGKSHTRSDFRPEPRVSVEPTLACEEVHRLLLSLPVHHSPTTVKFTDGLYFVYEKGETSPHASAGRVVRVGNHPNRNGWLIKRLEKHFRTSVGAKNASVFRKYIGGALIRKNDPQSMCLAPAPGQGHWEKQDEPSCERCTPYEKEVTRYIKEQTKFRCLKITEMSERNSLERLLVATIAQCKLCEPGKEWLGRFAYSAKVKASGLWNSDYVNGPTMTREHVAGFTQLVEQTAKS